MVRETTEPAAVSFEDGRNWDGYHWSGTLGTTGLFGSKGQPLCDFGSWFGLGKEGESLGLAYVLMDMAPSYVSKKLVVEGTDVARVTFCSVPKIMAHDSANIFVIGRPLDLDVFSRPDVLEKGFVLGCRAESQQGASSGSAMRDVEGPNGLDHQWSRFKETHKGHGFRQALLSSSSNCCACETTKSDVGEPRNPREPNGHKMSALLKNGDNLLWMGTCDGIAHKTGSGRNSAGDGESERLSESFDGEQASAVTWIEKTSDNVDHLAKEENEIAMERLWNSRKPEEQAYLVQKGILVLPQDEPGVYPDHVGHGLLLLEGKACQKRKEWKEERSGKPERSRGVK
ncbi:hypothetical protein C8J56DRAFT_896033 [Mycena floridula]|nr:hypothetical protein C8J56DRAFT_896033 [Mycena floridula]